MVELGGVEEVVVVEAEDTAELAPRATRAISSEVMFTVSPDPPWASKVEVEVEAKEEVVMVGAGTVRDRRAAQEARARVLCAAPSLERTPFTTTQTSVPNDDSAQPTLMLVKCPAGRGS